MLYSQVLLIVLKMLPIQFSLYFSNKRIGKFNSSQNVVQICSHPFLDIVMKAEQRTQKTNI